MARTYSQEIARNTPLPEFSLRAAYAPGVSAPTTVGSDDFADARVLVIVFMCNHCPYARHVEPTLIRLARDYSDRRVQFLAISSNDPAGYPEDSFDGLAKRAQEQSYPFPYLFDETQEVAQEFGAVCTPDPFVYGRNEDGDLRLVYHGQVDASRPDAGVSGGDDLRRGIDDALAGRLLTFDAVPSVGCSIKWREE